MIAGFNFTKILAEKKAVLKGNVNVNNNISVKSVEETDLSLGKQNQKALKFVFEFNSKYEPSIGNITLEGEVLFIEDPKVVKEILTSWKKDKRIPKDVMLSLLNTTLSKCNIQALVISQEINLPPPIPLPKVGASQPKPEKRE